jgi:hypothetical protein
MELSIKTPVTKITPGIAIPVTAIIYQRDLPGDDAKAGSMEMEEPELYIIIQEAM